MAERVQDVPSDFAFEEESNPPPVAEADPCVGPAEEVMVEVDDTGFATCPGFCPEQLTPETFYKLYPFAIHSPGGIPNCPPISWLPGHNPLFSVACGVATQMASAAQVCTARKLTAIAVSRTIGYG